MKYAIKMKPPTPDEPDSVEVAIVDLDAGGRELALGYLKPDTGPLGVTPGSQFSTGLRFEGMVIDNG